MLPRAQAERDLHRAQTRHPTGAVHRALWYASAPSVVYERERILPSGCVEIILNLNRDFLMDCAEGQPDRPNAPALVVGARSVYEIVDTADMASLIGIHFLPGGFAPFVRNRADDFSNRNMPLETLWGASVASLRDALREVKGAQARLLFLERHLIQLLRTPKPRHAAVDFALREFSRDSRVATVETVSRSVGWSSRRFSQVFREEVGFSPKVWCRIRRFQRVVRRLHAGDDIRGRSWRSIADTTTNPTSPMSFERSPALTPLPTQRCARASRTTFECSKFAISDFSKSKFRRTVMLSSNDFITRRRRYG